MKHQFNHFESLRKKNIYPRFSTSFGNSENSPDLLSWSSFPGVDPNGLDHYGVPPLHRAINKDQVGIAQTLVYMGADLEGTGTTEAQVPWTSANTYYQIIRDFFCHIGALSSPAYPISQPFFLSQSILYIFLFQISEFKDFWNIAFKHFTLYS